MNPVEHFLIGWCVASTSKELTRRERFLVTAAAVVADVDGLAGGRYHHLLTHNLATGVAVTLLAWAFGKKRGRCACMAFLSFHTHILGDLVGARGPDGYQWPLPYFLPFSRTPALVWSGQWPLNGWQNIVLGVALLALTLRRRFG